MVRVEHSLVIERPPAEEKAAIDQAIEKAIALLPQLLAGDLQGAMGKLHTDEKPPAKKEPEKKAEQKAEPAKKEGLLSGLFGRKK